MTRHICWCSRALFIAAFTVGVNAVTPLGSASAQDALPPAVQLVARHVTAIGGRSAALAKRVSRATGTFEMAAAGLKGTLSIVSQAPNRMVSRIIVPGMPAMLSGFDGTVGWSVEPLAGTRLVAGAELDLMRENANALAVVRDVSLFRTMQTVERTESGGQPCYRVRLVWQSGRESYDCYHTESGLLIATDEVVESPVGKLRVVSTVSDYRNFGGTLFPTRTVLSMMGADQVLTISTIEFDGIDTSVINPPAEIRKLISGGAKQVPQALQVQPEATTQAGAPSEPARRRFVGSSMFVLANFVPAAGAPSFYQLNLGYALTPKDVTSLELITWKYRAPLGIPWGSSMDDEAEKYPGHVRGIGIGAAYQRFLWRGAYYGMHALPLLQQYVDAGGKNIQNGFQLFLTHRAGYRVNLLRSRVFLEPSVAITHWPINTNVPESFARMDRRWPKYFMFEPGLHFGFRR